MAENPSLSRDDAAAVERPAGEAKRLPEAGLAPARVREWREMSVSERLRQGAALSRFAARNRGAAQGRR